MAVEHEMADERRAHLDARVLWDLLALDVRYAWRSLRRKPAFTAACVLTLALALAGTSTLLSVFEAFVFRRLAVPMPEQVVGIHAVREGFSAGFSGPALQALEARQQALTGVCGVTAGYITARVQADGGVPRQRLVEAVTGNCYELLGVNPVLGRSLTRQDGFVEGNAAPVALISDRFWRQELGSAPDVIGRVLRVEGTPLTIVGLLPATYRGMNADEAFDIALPLPLTWTLRISPPLAMHAVGRLRPGVDIGEATAHLTAIWPEVFESAQTTTTVRIHATAPPLRVEPWASGFSRLRERYRGPLYALVALALCLLLLACVNLGGLSLARLLARREALAVQLAMGAARSRLAAQLLGESLAISVASALVAVPLARWGARLAAQLLWPGGRPLTIEATAMSTTVLMTGTIGALAALLVAAPGIVALFVQRWDLDARSVGHGSRAAPRRVIIGTQLALCFVLVFCGVLFTRIYGRSEPCRWGTTQPGCSTQGWTARVEPTCDLRSATTIGSCHRLLPCPASSALRCRRPSERPSQIAIGSGRTRRLRKVWTRSATSSLRASSGRPQSRCCKDASSPGLT
jgi:hypothetical protein